MIIGRYDAGGGGAERWTDRFTRWLLGRGCAVHLIARTFVGVPEGATRHPVAAPGRLPFAEASRRATQACGADACFDMGDGWGGDVLLPHHGTRRGGFECVHELTAPALRPYRRLATRCLPRYREFAALESRQLTAAGRVIALSHMVEGHLKRLYGVGGARVTVIPNGVDLNDFPFATDDQRTAARRDLQVEGRVLLIVAHNFRLKGLAAAIAALPALVRERPTTLLVAGGGRPRRYRRLAGRLGVGDCVRFVGAGRDVRVLYAAADVLVHPTWYDPCSLVVLEALASGVPVATTAHNGAADLLHGAAAGAVIEHPGDAAALADAVSRLSATDLRRQARAVAERYPAAANFAAVLALAEAARARPAA